MGKHIGFIDYYLDEWHANNYPAWIREASGGEYTVDCCFGLTDVAGVRTNRAWAEAQGIRLCTTIGEVVEQSDAIIVLSPNNPEYHEELSALPLASGKPVYIDKTFADTTAAAARMFDAAQRAGTPMFTSSALRFAEEYTTARRDGLVGAVSVGGGRFAEYCIHQIEPLVSLFGTQAQRIQYWGTDDFPAMIIEFSGGRRATISQFGEGGPGFSMALSYTDGSGAVLDIKSDFFRLFIAEMVDFFLTGQPKVSREQTMAVIAVREAGLKAAREPLQWIEVKY